MITWANVVSLSTDFECVTPSLRTLIINQVNETIDPALFCGADTTAYKLAQMYLAAHYAAVQLAASKAGTAAGPVQSESVGGLSVSYKANYSSSASMSREGYERTPWGAMFLELLRSSPCGGGLGMMVL